MRGQAVRRRSAERRARWWATYAERKDDEGEDLADSLMYGDKCHLPRTAPAPAQVAAAKAAAASGQAAAASLKAAAEPPR